MDVFATIGTALRVALENKNEAIANYVSVCSMWSFDSDEAQHARTRAMNAIEHHLDMMVLNDNKHSILKGGL